MTARRVSAKYDAIEPVSPLKGLWDRARAWFENARKGSLYSLAVALYIGYEAVTRRQTLLAIGIVVWLVVCYGVILPRHSSRIKTPEPVPAGGPDGSDERESQGRWEKPRWGMTGDDKPGIDERRA